MNRVIIKFYTDLLLFFKFIYIYINIILLIIHL